MQYGNVYIEARRQSDWIATKPTTSDQKMGVALGAFANNTYVNRHPSKPCRIIVKIVLEPPGERKEEMVGERATWVVDQTGRARNWALKIFFILVGTR